MLKSRYGVVAIPMPQSEVSHGRYRGTDHLGHFSPARPAYAGAGVQETVGIVTSSVSTRGRVHEGANSTMAPLSHFVGTISPFPTSDLFRHFDAEEINFYPHLGDSVALSLGGSGHPIPHARMDSRQGPREIFRLGPAESPTLGVFSGSQPLGPGEDPHIDFGDDSKGRGVFSFLSSAAISNEWRNPQGLSAAPEQPPSPGRFQSSDWCITANREIGLGIVSPFETALPAVADLLIEDMPRILVSDISITREVDPSVSFTWEDPDRSIPAEKLSVVPGKHQLASQFTLGIGGETPAPSVVDLVDRDKHEWETMVLEAFNSYYGESDDDPEYQAWLASLPDVREGEH